MQVIRYSRTKQAAFTLAELVVAIALSGIIVLLCTKVYLIFTPQFRKDHRNSEMQFARLLKVSSLEKLMQLNIGDGDLPSGEFKTITPGRWLGKIVRLDRSPDSLAITWSLNQYARDSLYTVQDLELASHFNDLSEYYQDHLYLSSISIEVYGSDESPGQVYYYLYNDSPNLTRIMVKDLLNETD